MARFDLRIPIRGSPRDAIAAFGSGKLVNHGVKPMPETGGSNIELAHHLNEGAEHGQPHPSRLHEILEIIEAIVLALVAVTTAWSGYQAARWDGKESQLYEYSTKLRIQAQGLQVRGDQERMYNATNVADWLRAQAHGEGELAALFERRFLPEFSPAFEAWKKTDPIHNPSAPPGPAFMPEYRNTMAAEAAQLNQEASDVFEEGTRARERADDYVRVTVLLATVLLLTAISQRFRMHQVRIALVVTAFLLLLIPLYRILTLPRA